MFHVKQSALAIFDSFLGAAFVRMKHEAQTNVAPRFSFPLDGKGRVFSYDGVSHEGQQLDR